MKGGYIYFVDVWTYGKNAHFFGQQIIYHNIVFTKLKSHNNFILIEYYTLLVATLPIYPIARTLIDTLLINTSNTYSNIIWVSIVFLYVQNVVATEQYFFPFAQTLTTLHLLGVVEQDVHGTI